MKISFRTHRGLVKKVNEDRYLVRELGNGGGLVAVADGLGGHAAGERAAQIASECLGALDPSATAMDAHMSELVQTINRKILDASAKDPDSNGMGTTLTAAFINNGVANWIHVGDSRLYLFREGELVQVTDDHSVAGLLLRAGEINGEEARVHPMRNLLMSCLGREEFEADVGVLELETGDMLMLSTDGLHDRVPEGKILSALRSYAGLEKKADALIDLALGAGGRDNITVVLAQT